MLRRRIYYALKPFLPWTLRMRVRGIVAVKKRRRFERVWPIDPSTKEPPKGWQGWPEGKPFAFVITHDVEGPDGLAKCRQLAELEMSLGFRSSFNFIPEGSYNVSVELRSWLVENGFEVGVHDLHHDGKLFSSQAGFLSKATRINQYLRDWGASGYRSGFMLRNLDWLHALDIVYDASTFDTDPFEPQPDGAGTIFPFWIAPPADQSNRPGYVELPYTLPQDSSLFLVLREPTPKIWLEKLDWVAAQGGMALVNVHPDYVRFPGEAPSPSTFSSDHYSALLNHVRNLGPSAYWQPLPRAVAKHTAASRPTLVPRAPRKRVCIITYSFYECDTRVFRYGETLAERGDEVDVLSIGSSAASPREEVIDGCRVHRLQDRDISEKSQSSFVLPLLKFLLRASWWLSREQVKKPYDLVHVHNLPDFLVFAAWLPKLFGTSVVLDIHDILPELFVSKFKTPPGSAKIRMLKLVERLSAAFSNHVILANHLWLKTYTDRSASPRKCSVVINYVENRIFFRRNRIRTDDKLIVLFPGSLQWHQGLDIAINAFPKVAAQFPTAELHIYGEGPAKADLKKLAATLGLERRIVFNGFIPTKDIADIMSNADLGIVPKRADSFGNEAYSTKIMEFMSLGIPVVVSKTRVDQYYFNDDVVKFFEPGSSDAMASAMIEVLGDRNLRAKLVENATAYSDQNRWDNRKVDYLALVDRLCAPARAK
ncbi:MAG: glycosyltransferase [Opitutus sp.]